MKDGGSDVTGTEPAAATRLARPEDAASLSIIDSLVSGRPGTARRFEACCHGQQGLACGSLETALVMEAQGRIIGFLVFARVLDEVSIYNIVIHPDDQGRGLGREILESSLAYFRRGGALRCLLEVRESNRAARSLYRACDFELVGRRKNYYPSRDGREDALLMSRQL